MKNPSHEYQDAIEAPRARSVAPLGDRLVFLRGFLAQPRQVASIVPSSAVLGRRLAVAAGSARARTIVELGPGTGGTTRALLRAARPEARLLLVELSPMFHLRLRRAIDDPRVALQFGSAEHLERFLDERRLPPPDAVLSGIPFSTIAADTADRIAAAIARCLAPGGRFVAYQVRPAVAGYLAPYLGAPETAWEWRNVPPVRVFRWVKPDAAG
jgi:phosphatidylethanolamine/phosphatidyl-N-methylethanolamine N-methyltransferase